MPHFFLCGGCLRGLLARLRALRCRPRRLGPGLRGRALRLRLALVHLPDRGLHGRADLRRRSADEGLPLVHGIADAVRHRSAGLGRRRLGFRQLVERRGLKQACPLRARRLALEDGDPSRLRPP